MRRLNIFIVLFSTILLSGCNNSVTDFVKDTMPSNLQPADPSIVQSPMAIKVSPGRLLGTAGTDRALAGTITTTNKTFSMGSDRAVNLTISRTRVSPQ